METKGSTRTDQLISLLIQRVDSNRADLVARFHHVLQESLFSNRASVRPSQLKLIAEEEAEALLNFLRESGFSGTEHGEKLHQAGFNIGSVLKLSQVSCQFLFDHLEDDQVAFVLDTIDSYRQAVAEGYIKSMQEEQRVELERVRNALTRGST